MFVWSTDNQGAHLSHNQSGRKTNIDAYIVKANWSKSRHGQPNIEANFVDTHLKTNVEKANVEKANVEKAVIKAHIETNVVKADFVKADIKTHDTKTWLVTTNIF
jgi:ribosomal protein S19